MTDVAKKSGLTDEQAEKLESAFGKLDLCKRQSVATKEIVLRQLKRTNNGTDNGQ